MDINPDNAVRTAQRKGNTTQSAADAPRGKAERVSQSMTATITDIKPDEVTLRLRSGQIVTGRLKEPIEAGIGSVREFMAHFENGTLTLQMKPVAENQMQKSAIIEMLLSNGMKASPENIKLAQSLLENKMPVTAENLQKLTQAARVMNVDVTAPDAALDKAMFFLKNQMPPTSKNAELLTNYINGSAKMNNQLTNLLAEIETLPEAVQKTVLQALAGSGKENALQNAATEQARAGQAAHQAAPTTAQTAPTTQQAAPATIQGTAHQPQQNAVLGHQNMPVGGQSVTGQAGAQNANVGQPSAAAGQPAANQAEAVGQQVTGQQSVGQAPAAVQSKQMQAGHLQTAAKEGTPEQAAEKMSTEDRAALIRDAVRDGTESSPERAERNHAAVRGNRQDDAGQSELFKNVRSRLKFDFDGSKSSDIDEFLNELKTGLEAARTKLAEAGPQAERALKTLDELKSGMEFVNQIKNNIFVQLPVAIENRLLNSEILVFRDKRSQKKSGGSSSAMIALDTAVLGRFEVYVQKKNRSVSCQFRLRDDDIEKLVKSNMPRLRNLLQEQHYELDLCTYRKSGEGFTLLEKEEQAADEVKAERGRTAFDMRL